MTRTLLLTTTLSVALLTSSAVAQSGGSYEVTWRTIDSGGVMNVTGGAYSAHGTIGQADAAEVSGGAYVVHGGFWVPAASVAVPDPLLPTGEPAKTNRYLRFTTSPAYGSAAGFARLVTGSPEHLQSAIDGGTAGSGAFAGIHPVEPTNGTGYGSNVVLSDNTLTVTDPPARLWFEIQLGAWAPDMLRAWQVDVDEATFCNGVGGCLATAEEPCANNSECAASFGPGSQCGAPLGQICRFAYQDYSNPDFAALDLAATDLSTLRFGSTVILDPWEDDGRTWYGGNLVLDVPSGARGTYVIELAPYPGTFLNNSSSASIPIVTYQYAVVVVPVPEVIRVRPITLDGFAIPTPDVLYLGPPMAAPEEDATQPGLTFTAAPLQCDPYVHSWSGEGIISAYGAEVMPGSTYEVQRANPSCPDLVSDEGCWSAPLTITTAKYGDVWPLFDGPGNPPQPDFSDIAAMVNKFLAAGPAAAPIKAVAQLQPNCVFPDRAIDFRDIATDVQAFLGVPYASSNFGPCTCPSAVTCSTTPCGSDLNCAGVTPNGGLCVGGFCTDPCGRCTP